MGCKKCVTILLFSPEFILLKLWLVVFRVLPPAKEDPFVNLLLNFTSCCLGTFKPSYRFHLTLSLPVVASTSKKMPVRIYDLWSWELFIFWLLLFTFLFTPTFLLFFRKKRRICTFVYKCTINSIIKSYSVQKYTTNMKIPFHCSLL